MAMYPIGQPELQTSTTQLKEDLVNLSHILEEFIYATANDSHGHIKEIRSQAETRLNEVREHLGVYGEHLHHDTHDSMAGKLSHPNRYVRANPWIGVGLGVALGVAVGTLVGRR